MIKKIIVFVLVLVLVFLGFKIVKLKKYNVPEIEFNKESIFKDVLKIEKAESEEEYETLTYEELTIKNFFKDYKESDIQNGFNYKENEEGFVTSYYKITSSKQYVKMLNEEAFVLQAENEKKEVKEETDKDLQKYFDKYNIKNDVDLLKHIKENYYFNNTVLTTFKNIKNHYLLNLFVTVSMPEFYNIVLIEGELTGYIIETDRNTIKDIYLLHGDKQYIISLTGNEIINDEFIKELLQTVKFN